MSDTAISLVPKLARRFTAILAGTLTVVLMTATAAATAGATAAAAADPTFTGSFTDPRVVTRSARR